MISKIFIAKLFHIPLVLTLLVGALPVVNHMQMMPAIQLGMKTAQSYIAEESVNTPSAVSCCDAMGSASQACDFMVSQFVSITLNGDRQQILNSSIVVQSTSLRVLSPPPKA